MSKLIEEATLVTRLNIRPEASLAFAAWQAEWHARISAFSGFISLEILSPDLPTQPEWVFVQRFISPAALHLWRESKVREDVLNDLVPLLAGDKAEAIKEDEPKDRPFQEAGVTEVFVTHVTPEKRAEYEAWIAKVHQIEAKFPGFRKVYVQSPKDENGSWITLLQFDSPENLDRWLSSKERQGVLQESKAFVKSLEDHRVISSFAGWFGDTSGAVPPVWKQTMLVLLVLFPIVMLELKFLSPLTSGLNPSLGTFIGNAISVSLVSWPTLPIAIRFLGWWLTPEPMNRVRDNVLGAIVVVVLYLMEITILWNLL